ncbi:MAG TPA: hypothetical protein VK714_19490 [Myxococcota bacterium]|nr:hypothetical protein [Myxococcota bacterium]
MSQRYEVTLSERGTLAEFRLRGSSFAALLLRRLAARVRPVVEAAPFLDDLQPRPGSAEAM